MFSVMLPTLAAEDPALIINDYLRFVHITKIVPQLTPMHMYVRYHMVH